MHWLLERFFDLVYLAWRIFTFPLYAVRVGAAAVRLAWNGRLDLLPAVVTWLASIEALRGALLLWRIADLLLTDDELQRLQAEARRDMQSLHHDVEAALGEE